MPRETLQVDWRYEFDKLSPYLKGQGGVVRIIYNGDNCAPHEFSEILKTKYENKPDNQVWRSIRIDREWHSTRYLSDILYEFDKKFPDSGDKKAADPKTAAGFSILSENVFQGDAEISIDNLAIYSDQTFELPAERDQRVRDVCQRYKGFLSSGGHMMVVLNHAPIAEQGDFWNHFWHDNLEVLVNDGLFFVQMVDRSDEGGRIHDMAPVAKVDLDLPEGFDDRRQDEAYDDLVDVLIKETELTSEAASAAANAHITSNFKNIKGLYDNLPWLIIRLNQSRG